jgi:MSHA biogenesis protein MshL
MKIGFCKVLLLVTLALLISSCVVAPTHPTAMHDIQDTLQQGIARDKNVAARAQYANATPPAAVKEALMPSLAQLPAATVVAERRFNVSVNNAPAKTFFMSLVEGTHYNMVVSPDIEGTISLHLKNVTVEDVLDAVQDTYGIEYQRTAYGFEILPHEMQTRVFTVNYPNFHRTGNSKTQLNSTEISEGGGSSGGSSTTTSNSSGTASSGSIGDSSGSAVNTQSDMDPWANLKQTVTSMIGTEDGRSVNVNPQAGIVMVHAYPEELREVANYLNNAQNSLSRQVIIEAKILEVRLSDQYQAGVNWSLFGADQVGGFIDPTLGAAFTLHTQIGEFHNIIELLETQGNVQVLSSPHIATVNNQPAVIKVGGDAFYVTSVTTNVVPTGSSSSTSQSVGLTPFFSGITLDVTPEISDNNDIILHIHPSVSTVSEEEKTIDLGTSGGILKLPLAASTVRESDNIVRAHNCQIIAIGGLMENNTKENLSSTPGASKIPFVGAFFRKTGQESSKTELIILLRAIVPTANTWPNRLQTASDQYQKLDRKFHVGGLPRTFGNEGEMSGE